MKLPVGQLPPKIHKKKSKTELKHNFILSESRMNNFQFSRFAGVGRQIPIIHAKSKFCPAKKEKNNKTKEK